MTWAALAPWLATVCGVLLVSGALLILVSPDAARCFAAFWAAWADAMDYRRASYRQYRDEALESAARRKW